MFEKLQNVFKPKQNVEISATEDLAKKGMDATTMKETEAKLDVYMTQARNDLNKTIEMQKDRDPKFKKLANDPEAFEAEVLIKAKRLASGEEKETNWFNNPQS